MTTKRKRKIEIFSAGCPTCKEAIKLVESIACDSCEIKVHDMNARGVATKAKKYGVVRVPSIVIDGEMAECCADRGVDAQVLRSAGVGLALT